MLTRRLSVLCLCLLLSAAEVIAQSAPHVSPAAVRLGNPEATQQVLVQSADRRVDLTRAAHYSISDPAIAAVDAVGLVQPKAEGKTTLVVRHEKHEVRVPVEVAGLKAPPAVSFESQVMPILSRAGCNMGSCHGKAEGKAGFKLSIFGFDPDGDFEALTKETRGRRVFPAAPDSSLMLLKATGQIAHGGGRRMGVESLHYQRLRRWIAEGAVGPASRTAPEIVGLEVEPREQVMPFDGVQQLRVSAIDGDGKRHCVTLDAQYESNAPTVAKVDVRGTVRTQDVPGQAAILVRYLGHVTSCRVTLPRSASAFKRPPENNFIDRLAWDNLERLGIPPAGLADDATFLRRVYLDTIGTLPTAAEARAFLADARPNKRALLIDQLLDRPEYADYWAMRWSDLLRVDRDAATPAGAVAITRWLRRQFAQNRPYDDFVRAIVTARGPIADEGPAGIYKSIVTPEDLSRSFSQLFLGIRIQCAQCHHHPSDKWGQEDYYALAGFFTGVGHKATAGGGELIFAQKGRELIHPRTKKLVPVRPLGAPAIDLTTIPDRRVVLARWMTSPDNPTFTRSIANRLWSHYFGRGLVEPIDDLRATNPATNEPLLDALTKHLRESRYDLKAFTRTLLNSRLYQLASPTMSAAIGGGNGGRNGVRGITDDQNFSHAHPRAIPAEVLLDAISQATGVPEKFNGWPEGYRAIQIWDNRMPSYFFRIFGRPVRATVCECERSHEPSIAQALHLMNSEEIMNKIRARTGAARRLANSKLMPAEIVDELYLSTLSRFPTDAERARMLRVFTESGPDRQAAVEDVLWALLNTRGFVYNH
ncbi:MAG: DUF1549 domain-containing protein [Planctomycetes bacterium]|nr:DUF1549 domain-containing protein [Planctomycetota bacterium]